MFSKNGLCLFLVYCFQSLISRWHERRYCNVCITNTQILFTRGSIRVRKLGETNRATKAQKTFKHVRGNAPRNILRSRVAEIPFYSFWGVIWHIYENVTYNNTQLGENWRGQVPPQSPVALLLLFTTVTKILHSLTQTLLIVDALVCWSCHKRGHKARQCPKKRGTVYVPFSCCDFHFLHHISLEKTFESVRSIYILIWQTA